MIFRLAAATALLLSAGSFSARAQESPGGVLEPELRTYQLVFVVPDPDFEEDQSIGQALADHRVDRLHTASDLYVRNLVKADAAVLAGPLPDTDDIMQVAVVDRATRAEAEAVFGHSPAIETGRMRLETYTWWTVPGVLKKPKDADLRRVVHLGLLRRPADAPSYSEKTLEELQAGHLAHIRHMEELGELVLVGPIENGGDLRGILVFRTKDPDLVRKLVAEDPMVKAGRLELELHRWQVPRQALPPRPRD